QISVDVIDQRSDLCSCGVVLYEFLTGVDPFRGAGRKEPFRGIKPSTPSRPSRSTPAISQELASILLKLLEKDQAMGYQTAADLRADLKRIKREIDSEPWSSDGYVYGAPASRRNYWLGGLAAAAAVILVSAIGYSLYSGEESEVA